MGQAAFLAKKLMRNVAGLDHKQTNRMALLNGHRSEVHR